MSDPSPNQIRTGKLYLELGLLESDYAQIVDALGGRLPNWVEVGMFSVLWSEHCSYRSSRHLLKTLPVEGPRVLQGPGENAGVVDVGDGLAAVFKIESHNHPSAVEPYQGAATGVGGIIRDIIAMGARPIALLDSLRFGDPTGDDQSRRLFSGVVSGIAGYGNCVGVPIIGGEVEFGEAWRQNPLVNAMCVGVVKADRLMSCAAQSEGNVIIAYGSATGCDGIHGATFASVEDPAERERSAVQVGDPFMGKLLIEATLELLEQDLVVSLQDMGAAGITGSASEMAFSGGLGVDIDVDAVPVRESGMAAWQVMLSESQERMLAEVRNDENVLRAIGAILDRWQVPWAVVGRVTSTGSLRVYDDGAVIADVPVAALSGGAPARVHQVAQPALPVSGKPEEVVQHDLGWVHGQFDSMVQVGTVFGPGEADAGVVRLPGSRRALAATVDCVGSLCAADPYEGARRAVAESLRNLACVGASPAGITNCLNMGNPENPEVAWQLEQVVRGIGDACRAFGVPVTGGNVSLYNQTGGRDIWPTPVIGAVGILDDYSTARGMAWQAPGNKLVLVGRAMGDGSSQHGDWIDAEIDLQAALRESIAAGLVASAHDVGLGGLAEALAESSAASGIGCEIELDRIGSLNNREWAVVAEVASVFIDSISGTLQRHGVDFNVIGVTGGDVISITDNRSTDCKPNIYERELVAFDYA